MRSNFIAFYLDDPFSLPLGVYACPSDFVFRFLKINTFNRSIYRRACVSVSVALSRGTGIKICEGSKVRRIFFERIHI